MRQRTRGLMGLLAAALAPWAAAADIAMLSGGAVEPGIKPAVAAFEAATGHRVKLTFNTAPELARRLAAGETWDLVIAPLGVLDPAAAASRIGSERVSVGRVGIGVAVGPGATPPDIGDVEALKRALLGAEAVVFNKASTGVAFEGILRRLQIAPQVEPKAVRPADGAGVMERLLQGRGTEIGLGAITEILLFQSRGVKYVGPLPADVQNFTAYAAALPASGTQPEAARQLLAFLGQPEARALLAGAGVDPAP